jgi:invasion protein IalB
METSALHPAISGTARRCVAAALLTLYAWIPAQAAGPLFAQAGPRPPARPAQAAPAAPAQPPPAQPAPAATPEAPRPVRVETINYGNWTVTCQEFAEPKGRQVCTGQLQVAREGTSQVVLLWAIGPGDDGKPVNAIRTLPGVLIAPGVELKIGKTVRQVAFTSCEANHCLAVFDLNDAFAREIAGVEQAEVVVTSSNKQRVQFAIPIAGIDRAIAAVRR